MKVTIQTTEMQSREIDWSKPMVVVYKDIYVRTTGGHHKSYFTGMDVITGVYSNEWMKELFTPCTTPITVTFENEI